ncbi:hypothetical protein [Halobacillus karajensis]|nr:hypothetical protein [Halobacillus karajensis]
MNEKNNKTINRGVWEVGEKIPFLLEVKLVESSKGSGEPGVRLKMIAKRKS